MIMPRSPTSIDASILRGILVGVVLDNILVSLFEFRYYRGPQVELTIPNLSL